MIWKPTIFKLSKLEDIQKLEQLKVSNVHLNVYDSLDSQISELVKIRNPKLIFDFQGLKSSAEEFIRGLDLDRYGVWVFYPWNNDLVRLLPEDDFVEVRTNRNKHKLSGQEQYSLSKKVIGVVGLSVGQSVALALTMERSFGELRIADFDDLELSNLNRIRTPLKNLGIPKTISVAREIAEIDPFLEVKCFHEGITEENISSFFDEGEGLDLLIDECDSIDIKVLLRKEAKKRKLPVLMDTSDKGMLDVERFDLDPSYKILHGKLEDFMDKPLSWIKENRMEVAYSILEFDSLSERMKKSIPEIGRTITTWPQLGSQVVYGGGICADVSRKLLLGDLVPSGRFYFDTDGIIGKGEDA